MLLLLCAAIALPCIFADLPKLVRKKKPRDLFVWSVMWIAGFGATACSVKGIEVPSPLLLLEVIYQPVNSLFEAWFYGH